MKKLVSTNVATTYAPPLRRAKRGRLAQIALLSKLLVVLVVANASMSLAADAHLIRVSLPIVGDVDQRVRQQISQAIADAPAAGERNVLILEFVAEPGQDAAASEFERSMALARFLVGRDLQQFRVVAWLPQPVSGHAVLPVVAAEEIVVHPDASLGAAGSNEPNPSKAMKAFYSEIAGLRRTIPDAVVMGMLDRREKVVKATVNGTRYLLEPELEELQTEQNVQSISTMSEVGDLLTISGNDLRLKHGFASHLVVDQRDLAAKLAVPLSSLQENPALDGEWNSARINVVGNLSPSVVDRAIRAIDDLERDGKNLICVWIDSPGGDAGLAVRLAGHIALLDAKKVRSVAYVQNQALSDAALVAVACDDLVMTKNAKLGGPGAVSPSREQIKRLLKPTKQVCKDKSMHWSLPVALFDKRREVFRYRMKGAAVEAFLSADEAAEMPEPDRWVQGDLITTPDEPLQLDAGKAVEFGLARYEVDDFAGFKSKYKLKEDPQVVEPTWADEFIEDLAQPHIAGTLLFFAFFALMVEISSPGLGAGGFTATLCFVVYFWSQYLNGTAGVLEVLLFLVGLAFIAVEVFVLPGFGLFGLGGGALMIASLVLASQTFVIPGNAYQLEQLPSSLMTVVIGLVGMFVGMYVLRKFLNRAPGLRRLMLAPPAEDVRLEREQRESLVRFEHLLNQIGVATTPLVPSGKAKFGSDLCDVVSDGKMIEKGDPVEVVEVLGNRIVVRGVTA